MNIASRIAALAALLVLLVTACTSAPEPVEPGLRTRGGAAAAPAPSISAGSQSAHGAERLVIDSRRGPADKIALLVGIDEYAPGTPASFKPLAGCVRDTELVRDVLERRFEFPPEDVLVLTNAEATHENIVRAFREWLIARASADTEVLFWFSGHGSRIPDLSGSNLAERGGKESTFIAYDSRAGGEDGAFDFSDDELRSLLHALTRITARVTVVTDSCHSGGSTRGVQRVRAADQGSKPLDFERLRATFWPADVPLRDDDAASEVESDRYVHIAACSDSQLAQEIDTEDAKGHVESHGALTFFLTQCLRDAQPTTSYRTLSDRASVRLSTEIPGQTVWREGALDRELFGARFRARPVGFLARALPNDEIGIDAGAMLGLRVGSRVTLYDGSSDARIGTASLLRVGAQSSVAQWEATPPGGPPDGALRAIEESRPFGQSPLAVHFESPRIAAWFQGSERVAPESGDTRLSALRLGADRDGGGVALFTPDGLRLWQHATPEESDRAAFVGELEAQMREELRYRALVALANDPGTVRVLARFEPPTPAELAQFVEAGRYARVLDAEARSEPGSPTTECRAVGALSADLRLAILVVENTSARDAYISVLSVSEDRGRNLIWPPGGQQDKVLPAGASQRIFVNVTAHEDWNLERPMRDRYLVIATSEAADFLPMTRVATLRGGPQDTAAGRGMPEMLSLALEKPPTRGVKLAKIDGAGWGITCVDLLVSRPDAR